MFGQSAGADRCSRLLLCEQTTGLFQRAIMQSAPLGVRDGRDAMTAAMRSAANAVTTGQVVDAQTAAVAAAAPVRIDRQSAVRPDHGIRSASRRFTRRRPAGRRGAAHRAARWLHSQRRRPVRRDGFPHCAAETPRPGRCCQRAGRLGSVDAAGVRNARATTRRSLAQAWRSVRGISSGLVAAPRADGRWPRHRTAVTVRRTPRGPMHRCSVAALSTSVSPRQCAVPGAASLTTESTVLDSPSLRFK